MLLLQGGGKNGTGERKKWEQKQKHNREQVLGIGKLKGQEKKTSTDEIRDDESLEATTRSFQSTYLEGKRRPPPSRRLMENQNNRTNSPPCLWKCRGQPSHQDGDARRAVTSHLALLGQSSVPNGATRAAIWLQVVTRSARRAKEGGETRAGGEGQFLYLRLREIRKSTFQPTLRTCCSNLLRTRFKGGMAVIALEYAQSIPVQGKDRRWGMNNTGCIKSSQ